MKTSSKFSFRRLAAAMCALLAIFGGASGLRATVIQSQDPAGYSSRIDGPGAEEIYDSFTDAAGNVYVVGRSTSLVGTVDVLRDLPTRVVNGVDADASRFGPDPQSTFTGGNSTYNSYIYYLFVIKYDRNGNVVWRRTAGSTSPLNGYDFTATGVAADTSGNVFVTGSLAGDAQFGSIKAGNISVNGNYPVETTLYVAMLDKDGNWQWVKPMQPITYVTGGVGASSAYNPGSALTTDGNLNLYLRNGGPGSDARASSPQGRSAGAADGHALALGSDGSVYIKGSLEGNSFFKPGDGSDVKVVWMTLNGTGTVPLGSIQNSGSTGRKGTIYLNTSFVAKLKATQPPVGSTGVQTTYAWDWITPVTAGVLTGADGNITSIEIGTALGGSFNSGYYKGSSVSTIGSVAVDDDSVYLTGVWKGNNVLGGAGLTTTPVTVQDGYVSRLRNGNGTPVYLSAFSSGLGNTSVYTGALVVDDLHNAYVTGAIGNNSSAAIAAFQGRTPTDGSTFSSAFAVPVNSQNFAIGKLNPAGDWQWIAAPTLRTPGGAVYGWATSLTRDAAGALYLGGGLTDRDGSGDNGSNGLNFSSSITLDAPLFGINGANGAFIAKLTDANNVRTWQYALQTNANYGGAAYPSIDTAEVCAGTGGTIYWAINDLNGVAFASSRSPTPSDNAYDTTTGRGAFLLPVLADGPYLSPTFSAYSTVICGQEVTPPAGAYKDANGRPLQPEIYVPGTTTSLASSFYWDDFGKKLFAVAATVAEVHWRVSSTLTSQARLNSTVVTLWPTTAQGLITHVTGAGAANNGPAVALEPAAATSTFGSILYSESNATVSGAKLLNATGEGYSVLLYSAGRNSSPTSAAVSLAVVRTYKWTNAAVQSNAAAVVGTALDPTTYNHADPEGKSGYVINARARIDANGPAAAYSFTTQKGLIIPVNTEETTGTPAVDADAGDDLWVIWSHLDTRGIGWPAQAVRYTAAWPTAPEKIVVASQLGSEMIPENPTAVRAVLVTTPNYQASDGTTYSSLPYSGDSFPNSSLNFNNGATIANTVDQRLYQCGVAGPSFAYSFAVPNGLYSVTLYFAEPASGPSGLRTMNVSLNGTPALTNFNVLTASGGNNIAYPQTLPVQVTNGTLNISFAAVTSAGATQAFVNAIKVVSAQELLDPAKFINPTVYNQPDRTLPGYNPNEEHALLAAPNLPTGTSANGRLAMFALRNDLNNLVRKTSDPYALMRYQDATDSLKTKFKVYQVLLTDSRYSFASFTGVAGTRVQPPYPLSILPAGSGTSGSGTAYFKDRKNQVWAKSNGVLTAQYFYGLQPDFWYDLNGDGVQDTPAAVGVPWLDRYNKDTLHAATAYGVPITVTYNCVWPGNVPILYTGDTVASARDGLPDIEQMTSATIIYEQSNGGTPTLANSAVRILPYTNQRVVSLPGGVVNGSSLVVGSTSIGTVMLDATTGYYRLQDLPYALKSRLLFAPSAYIPTSATTGTTGPALIFGGYKDSTSYAGRPLLLLNILSAGERDRLLAFGGNNGSTTSAWGAAVVNLYNLTRNPNRVDVDGIAGADANFYAGFTTSGTGTSATLSHADALGPKAMTAGKASGSLGYITFAENNAANVDAGLPVALHIIQVQNPPVVGDLKVILSDNPLDEKITIRHGADFAGDPSGLTFEWYYQPATSSTPPAVPNATNPTGSNGWILLTSGLGVNEYTFEGASLTTLADSWVYCRYKGYNANGYSASTFGQFAGDPSGTTQNPRPAFVPGWIKRVLARLNLFEAKVQDFASAPTQTYSSALVSAGTRYEGDIALNNDPTTLNNTGLIALYETILRRGLGLSIDGSAHQTNAAVNQSLLLAATRVSDLYMLLANEAYADAQDPTVGFTSSDGTVGSLAPSLFAFQNEVPNLLSEELALLEGRDDSSAGVAAAPVYNRLYWNFTKGLEGEPTYVQNYGVTDQNHDGVIDEKDARYLFPQGHGDAWGHYLSAVKSHYRLLRNPLYTWTPNSETTSVAGVAVEVDYLDEQKFAAAAAARANVGAEIVNLTYRNAYTADPSGEWQGYYDSSDGNKVDADKRAWGVVEWARRAGQGAYFDWVTANGILPAQHTHVFSNPIVLPQTLDPSTTPAAVNLNVGPTPTGLQKIDRTTVTDLAKIAASYNKVQAQMDQADQGLNPLGVTPGTIPFDIDPNFNEVGSTTQNQTHFEQIYNRAMAAVNNARGVFDYANELTNRLRQTQLSANDFAQDVLQEEHDFNSRLIEIFGYPYAGDIGGGLTYPTGYNGPDLIHYNYVAVNTVSGTTVVPDSSFTGFFKPFGQEYVAPPSGPSSASDLTQVFSFYFPSDSTPIQSTTASALLQVKYPQATAADWSFTAPASWGSRRAPGSLQLSIGDMVRAEAELRRGIADYQAHTAAIQDQIDLLYARSGLQAANIKVLDTQKNTIIGLNAVIGIANAVANTSDLGADLIQRVADDAAHSIPTVEGLATDIAAPLRGAIELAGTIGYGTLKATGLVSEIAANATELSKDQVNLSTALQIQKNDYSYEIQEQLKIIEGMLREDVGLRIGLFNLQQSLFQAYQQYQVHLTEGQRILEEVLIYRQKVAGVTQQNRYQDLTFRNFRNDALQKYRAAFDLAARYTYLAATTYDYETVQLGSSAAAGRNFLTDIVRERALGQFDGNNAPVVGVNGLSDPLARLYQNFQVLKGRLGINNPQIETGQFSLHDEMLRLRTPDAGQMDTAWQQQLQAYRVADLWQVPEFRRYCRPFAPEASGAQPGLVIPISTDITFGLNYFGLPLGPGDSSYDSSAYATKIRSVGVAFSNYNKGTSVTLSNSPRVYFVPAGLDVLRAPDDTTLATRQFDVVDQAIPTPFPVGTAALQNPNYIPSNDSLDSPFNQIRQFSRFLAYPDNGPDASQLVSDTRLIGRSVWNTKWLLIIPGGTLLNDANEGLNSFILGQSVPNDTTGARDGNGVSDIKLFFETYSYSGN